jgi:uncharacterized protein YndB with AHSA1/START domain
MSKKNSRSKEAADREIVITRVVNAPRELVWEAWTDPKQVAQWWGPRGFTTTIEEMDVRVGGAWKHVMHGPDGTDYPNQSVFTEVVKPARIVFSHGGGKKGAKGVHFESTWTFETVEPSKTKVTIRMVFATAAERDRVVKEYGAVEGGEQTLGRLSEHLGGKSTSGTAEAVNRDFVITRVFDAPRELVWKAWTEPKHMARWWGPKTFTNPVCELDVRVGGAFRIVMRGPDGADYPAKGFYREVVKPKRLVMALDHSELPDEWHDKVNPRRDKTAGKPALEALTQVTLEERDGKTKQTIRIRFDSAEVRDALLKIGMSHGWSQSLERLDALLAKS